MISSDDQSGDELLARLAQSLRDEPVPNVPAELLEGPSARRGGSLVYRRGLVLLALCAMVLGLLWFNPFQASNSKPFDPGTEIALDDPSPDRVVSMVSYTDVQPFRRLEQDLDEMEQVIERLRHKVALLDALRQVDAMLASEN